MNNDFLKWCPHSTVHVSCLIIRRRLLRFFLDIEKNKMFSCDSIPLNVTISKDCMEMGEGALSLERLGSGLYNHIVHANICHANTQGNFPRTVHDALQIYAQTQRRRIETEGKAKVVASVLGAEFVKFLAALAVLYRSF